MTEAWFGDLSTVGVVTAERRRHRLPDTERLVVKFGNSMGASIIRGPGSYGGDSGLFEVAVLDSDGELTYATPVTDDVLGYLTPDGVRDVLRRISELPRETVPS